MLNQNDIRAVLDAALQAGGDMAELFFEDTLRNTLEYRDGRVETALAGRDYGAGLRVMLGNNCAYAYTCDVSPAGLKEAAVSVAQAVGSARGLTGRDFVIQPPRAMMAAQIAPMGVEAKKRAAIAKTAYDRARAYSPEIVQASCTLADITQRVLIANSEGIWAEDERVRSRLVVQGIAGNANEMQTGFEGPGAGQGFEFFENLDVEQMALEAAKTAVVMLHAPFCPAGRMDVAIDGGFGGVIFHEACGHSLEATSVARGNSEFAGKLGEKIAHEKVTAIDDGTLPGAWGSIGYDDEGQASRRNVLIENGILRGYMIDILGGRRMGMAGTGSGRRQNYRYAPTSRMTNTYIAPGDDEGIIEAMASGLYAKKMGGGSVNPLTGEFNFSVQEGYLIKDGKLDSPVRGATLIGKGSEVLLKIDAVGQAMTLGQGMCGSASGSVPTNVGQPLIRVTDLLVGGRES